MNLPDIGIDDLPQYIAQVDKKIAEQSSVHIDGISRILDANGKRWRPCMVMAVAYHCGGGISEDVISAAAAVELIHLASLVHDDIMDGGTLRHGVPTINSKEGVNAAILGGDLLIAKGLALAAEVSSEAGSLLSRATAYLCEGQAMEMADQFNKDRTVQSLDASIKGKTSSMFAVSLMLGGLCAGLKESELAILKSSGEKFGLAYQYIDDVKDLMETPETTGKSVGNDIREGKYTLPLILTIKGLNGRKLRRLLEDNAPVPQIVKLLGEDGSIEKTVKKAEEYKQESIDEILKLKNAGLADAIGSLSENF